MTPLGPEREHYWRVQRMARAAGADPAAAFSSGALGQDDWTALVARCRACPWSDGCASWLARFEAEDHPPLSAPPGGCINQDTIAALAACQRRDVKR
jgi:hypothetical protein